MNDRLLEKIVHLSNGEWQVQSEKGKNLGTYKTEKEAKKRLQQVHYFKHMNECFILEDLDLDISDGGVPSVHSTKDDRYGHHNYKIEDPDLKRRLAEANPHLAKFLDDHYVWYLIAWAKGIDDGTTYQGFLNIYEDDTKWKKVHGSYSDGYRPEPDLVKDIVFNSIEEDLELDSTYDELEPGHLSQEGEGHSYYVLSQQQAGIFMPEYIEFCKKHFDAEDVEFLEETYAWAVNDPDGYHDVNMCKDEVNVYVIVWDDNGDSQEQGIDIESFKSNGWDSIVDLDSIPDYENVYEDLELDVSDEKLYTIQQDTDSEVLFIHRPEIFLSSIKPSESRTFIYMRCGPVNQLRVEFTGEAYMIGPYGKVQIRPKGFKDELSYFLSKEDFKKFTEHPSWKHAEEYTEDFVARHHPDVNEDLDLDEVTYDYDPSYLIKDAFWDSAEKITQGISEEEFDKENWIKRWGLAPGKWIIKRYDTFNEAYVDFLNYKFESWEDHVDLTCQDYPVLRRFAKTNEALDLDVEKVTSKIKFKDITTADGIVVGKRVILPEDRKNLLYTLLSEVGDVSVLDEFMFSDRYDCELSYYPPKNSYPEKAYLNFRDKNGNLKYVTGFGMFGLFIPEDIFEAVTEEPVNEDLDLDVMYAPDDSWKQYHCQDDIDYSLPIYDAERLIMERFNEISWYISIYIKKDKMWYQGMFENIPDNSLNGIMTFKEAYDKFLNYPLEKGDRIVVCYHQGAEYGYDDETEEDGILFGEEEYSILARGDDDWQDDYSLFENVNEDVELDVLGNNLLEPYLIPISDDDIIEKLPQDYNIYILPNGTVGYVEDGAIEMGSDLEDEIFDYIEKEVITIFASGGDSMEGTITYIHVEFPKNRLTQAQVDVLVRNKEWLWESRIPEDSEDFAGTAEYEYATDYFGYYGIAVSNTNADAVDTFLYINGYIPKLVEDVDLDVVEDAPRLIRDGKSLSEYGLSDNNVRKLINLITDKNRVYILEKALERNSESGVLAIYHDPDFLEYDIKLGSLVSCLVIADRGLEPDLSIAKAIDKMFNFSYATDWLNRTTNEDLDLDSIDTTSRVTKFKNPEGWNVYQLDNQSVDLKENILKVFKEYYPEGYLPSEIEKLDELTGYSWILTCTPRSILKDHGIMRIIVKDDAGSTMEMYDEFTHKTIVEAVAKLLDSEVKPVEEDLDLDVQSIKPEQVGRSTESHRKYKISMAALYRIRELKKDVYGETYGINGGYYLDNLIERVETGDEDLAGDIYLEVFNMNNEIEYRLSFGDYCICTLCQFSNIEFKGNLEVELARQIEEEMALPKLTDSVKEIELDIEDLLNLDDEEVGIEEDLDLDVVSGKSERFVNCGEPMEGAYTIGPDNKLEVIKALKNADEQTHLMMDAGEYYTSSNKDIAKTLDELYSEIWIYFPADMHLSRGNIMERVRGKLIIMPKEVEEGSRKYFEYTVSPTIINLLTKNAIDFTPPKPKDEEETNEDLELDVLDARALDDKIKEVIKRFLLDMGEYCVTIGDVLFEGNPAGIRVGGMGGHYEPIRDAAYKVHDGEVTFYYPDSLNSDGDEIEEWGNIEAAAVIDEATDPSEYLKNYHESNTMTYEQALYTLGDLWGYSREEIENDLISQI